MNVEAGKRTVQHVLGQPDEQLRIPRFQRPYAWGPEQVDELWDDVTDDLSKGHFLGSIVLSGDDAKPQVIDGQQRLTTLMLLLSVIRDACFDRNLLQQVERITDLFIVDKFADGDAQYRLRTGDKNWEVFRDFVLRRLDDPERRGASDAIALDADVRAHNRAMLDNLSRLRNLLQAKLDGLASNSDRIIWLQKADKHVVKDLELVVIRVGELDDAFLLFETLNDRGLQLSASDLLKNRLLGSIASKEGDEDVEVAAKHWDEMLEDLGTQVDVTRFLRHYLLGTMPKVKKDDVFGEFKTRMAGEGARTILEDLRVSARLYGEFENPAKVHHEATRRVLTDLQTLRAMTCYIALLPARRHLSQNDFLEFARLAEVVTYRYSSIVGLGTNELERRYHESAKLLIESKGEMLGEARAKLISVLPSSDQFVAAFQRASLGTHYLVKYTLRKLEESVSKEKQVKPTSEVHPEHIMPTNLSGGWVDDLGSDLVKHAEFVNRWGNLTLFLDRLNIPASNKAFADKKPYYAKSEVEMTRELATIESWGIAQIEARQQRLAEMADALWSVSTSELPSPTSHDASATTAVFRAGVGEFWPWVERHLIETSAEEIAHLADRLPHHLAEHSEHSGKAIKLAADLQRLIASWESLDGAQRAVVRAAAGYFLDPDDAVLDDQPAGLDDDAAVIDAAFAALGRSRD